MEKELCFESSLTIEEIEANFEGFDFFAGLTESLEEAALFEQGKAKQETMIRKRSLPAVNVAELRESLSMTQKAFANVLGVSGRTVEAWESGKSNPTPTAKKLMYLIKQNPQLVELL